MIRLNKRILSDSNSPYTGSDPEIFLEPADNDRLMSLCGPFDDNIKQLERRLGIEINHRDNRFKLTGKSLNVNAAAGILRHLYVETSPLKV